MKEILISSLAGVGVLVLDLFNLRRIAVPFILVALAALTTVSILDWNKVEDVFGHGMLVFDNLALAFGAVLAFVLLVWFVLFEESLRTTDRKIDLHTLVLFSFTGAIILASYQNLVMLFLGVEILSIPLYVLAASRRGDLLSNEAGFKYFFLGAFASALLLFGIALVFGSTGSFELSAIGAAVDGVSSPSMLAAGMVLMLAGFAFKTGLAPFHFWTPDVYQGSPTPFTALMATVVKGAAFIAMFRFFGTLSNGGSYTDVMAFLAAATLIVSNTSALLQSDTKRLLAYSSISHAGFMLGAMMFCTTAEPSTLLYYVLVYSISSLASFAVLDYVSRYQEGTLDIGSMKGLARRNPVMAGTMTLALLSMSGIPPLSGFMAKYLVITNVISGGATWLAIIMILTSAVAVYYYLRIIILMFTPIENAGRMVISGTQNWTLLLLNVAMIGLFFAAGILF
jgi:NADH-quinone oxidoreductase subunit N